MTAKIKKQKGYATVLTLILFSALGLSLFSVFNSGQIVTHKLKLQNAVDAATYSSVNVVAREMNYMAYTNRAMVANQIAIGQMVGMASWSRKIEKVVDNLDNVATFLMLFPPTTFVGSPLKQATSKIQQVLNRLNALLKIAVRTGVEFEKRAIGALSRSQNLVHAATSAVLLKVFPEVLQDNNGADEVGHSALLPLSLYNDFKSNFIARVGVPSAGGSGNMLDYDHFQAVVKKTDDGFVHDRSFRWFRTPKLPAPIGTAVVAVANPGLSAWKTIWARIRVENKAGNEFERKQSSGKYVWEWSAMDTVSLWVDYKYWSPKWYNPTRTKNKDIEFIPLGWGASHVTSQANYNYYNNHPWWPSIRRPEWGDAGYNKKSSNYAAGEDKDKNIVGISGLNPSNPLMPFYKFMKAGELIGPEFIAVVSKSDEYVRTRNKMIESHTNNPVPREGVLNVEKEGNMSNKRMYAVAKAQVYFSRSPDEVSGFPGGLSDFGRKDLGGPRQELANLFNPYWQVRLVDYEPDEIIAAQGVLSAVQ